MFHARELAELYISGVDFRNENQRNGNNLYSKNDGSMFVRLLSPASLLLPPSIPASLWSRSKVTAFPTPTRSTGAGASPSTMGAVAKNLQYKMLMLPP